jgi:S-DNA-T family DNA segregation ATPase FtsK/SpoIIIE
MKAKILKSQLFTLFLLTIITLVVFYYKETLPDNYLSISSNASHGFFSYYLTSWASFINYYTGAWIAAPCFLFTVFYIFIFSKRCDWVDLINIVSLSTFSVLTSYYLQPSLIGGGLYQFISTNCSAFASFGIWFLSLALFSWGTFRAEFTDVIKLTASSIKNFNYSPAIHAFERASNSCVNFAKEKFARRSQEVRPIEHNAEIEKIDDTPKENPVSNSINFVIPKSSNPIELTQPEQQKIEVLPAIVDVQADTFEDKSEELNDESEEYVDESQIGLSLQQGNSSEKVNDDKYYDIVKMASVKKGVQSFSQPDQNYFNDITGKIQAKLSQFKIEGRIVNVLKGPVVDTFEWELGEGEKIAKLNSTSGDLTLALSGSPIRMVYPMKGRTTVGIEVPRNPREYIFLDEVLASKEFTNTVHKLPLAMGKDAFGEPVVTDLASMPHMLVAGATGAGKSVFINTILVSLLVKKSPNQMKLILIDPKQLELALYAKLPHLLMPVVTDPKTATNALLWACQEMERRYSIMSEFGVRNIDGFNHKLKNSSREAIDKIRKHYEYSSEDTYELPYLVVIVDEFADLILSTKGKEIETHINRLAAKARASGIHLIIATQRPSVDVITGVIKANFPTRVSFKVTAVQDSRTILNEIGAEKLLGRGDMLFKHGVETTRLHSAFIEDSEIEALAHELSEMAPTYNPDILEFLENGGEEDAEAAVVHRVGDSADQDVKYDEAVQVVIEHRSASASLLQRRLGVGYNRAANLIDEMEARGVVGPAQGSKPRKVLVGQSSENLT